MGVELKVGNVGNTGTPNSCNSGEGAHANLGGDILHVGTGLLPKPCITFTGDRSLGILVEESSGLKISEIQSGKRLVASGEVVTPVVVGPDGKTSLVVAKDENGKISILEISGKTVNKLVQM